VRELLRRGVKAERKMKDRMKKEKKEIEAREKKFNFFFEYFCFTQFLNQLLFMNRILCDG